MQSNAKELQKTNAELLKLLISVNFDKSRIVIAEYELSDNFLTLYLEDKEDIKADLSDTLMYKLPVSKFAEIIRSENLNSYEGVKFTESGRSYNAQIEMNEPIAWFEQDASEFFKRETITAVLKHILKTDSIAA